MSLWEALGPNPPVEIPYSGPVSVEVSFVHKRVKRLRAKDIDVPYTVKPDVDNVLKAFLDGIGKSGVISDDAIVYRVVMEQYYANPGESPHTLAALRFD